jgi:hypothetical protein
LKEKINCLSKEDEKQPSKKKTKCFFSNSISSFFAAKKSFLKDEMQQK